ncbi:thioredoxin domain-containing protein 15-like isoform X1 [Montipora foliosa]|uniref:thioredoxin domain-containing protein 15-like isoform X1 n=1 Tax=Montipora foliosa TaxID=591990 RepID=UPI0035F13391
MADRVHRFGVYVYSALFFCFFYTVIPDCALSKESEPLEASDAEREGSADEIFSAVNVETSDTAVEAGNMTLKEPIVIDTNETDSIINSTDTEWNINMNETKADGVINNSTTSPKWSCKGRNNSQNNDTINQKVVIVHSDELLQQINSSENNETDPCAIVLFYTNYCPFSAKLAPLYNALGRVYNNLPVLAIDAHKQHSLNTRFGVVAVPTILLFHSGKPVLKFNNTVTLDDLRDFVKNSTGVEGNYSVHVSEEDYKGPLRSKPVEDRDYYLLFSVLFLVAFGVIMFSKSSYRQLVFERIQTVQWRRIFQWFSREKQD